MGRFGTGFGGSNGLLGRDQGRFGGQGGPGGGRKGGWGGFRAVSAREEGVFGQGVSPDLE
jgi:host factor-I protein